MNANYRNAKALMAIAVLTMLVHTGWAAERPTVPHADDGQSAERSTVFYTVGHADDWQLFMNPNAYYDAAVEKAKVVFIYLTAGDANLGTSRWPRGTIPYYLAREAGALAAAHFISIPNKRLLQPEDPEDRVEPPALVDVNGHEVMRYEYRNTVSYFFRLPDGFPLGDGARGSLLRLQRGMIPSLTPVTGGEPYHGWSDLVETLRVIVTREATGSTNVWANMSITEARMGDGRFRGDEDHSDHVYSALAMLDAIRPYPCINKAKFYGYQSTRMRSNLTEQQLIWEAATWGATLSGLLESGGGRNEFNATHNALLGRNHFKREVGVGPCHF